MAKKSTFRKRLSRATKSAKREANRVARKVGRKLGVVGPRRRGGGAGAGRMPPPPDFPQSLPVVVKDARDLARVFKDIETRRFARYDYAVVAAAVIATRIVRAHVPLDQGELRRQTKMVYHGRRWGTAGVICEIVYDTPYAAAQEAGTRPFKPPLGPLIDWARRQAPNLGLDRNDKSEIFGFAKGVQKAIMTRGIRAKWFERDSLPTRRRVLAEMLARALKSGALLGVAGDVLGS